MAEEKAKSVSNETNSTANQAQQNIVHRVVQNISLSSLEPADVANFSPRTQHILNRYVGTAIRQRPQSAPLVIAEYTGKAEADSDEDFHDDSIYQQNP